MFSTVKQATTENRLATLAASYVSELARAASGRDEFDSSEWEYETLGGGFGSAVGGTALYRMVIRAPSGRTCSLILKVLYERSNETSSSPYYWKREYEVYRSGMLDDLPAGTFSTPRVYGLQNFGDSCWIWMEEIEDRKSQWSLDDFHDIALRLGQMNGARLTGSVSPSFDWLSRNWHSAIVPALADAFDNLDEFLENPLARRALPVEAKDEILAIWRDRQLFQSALAQLPMTFCHTDAFRRNILHRKDDIVLLDWALASIGSIGEELVCLVAVSLYYRGYSAAYAEELDKTAFAGYVEGLRHAGWNGDPKLARIGYTCGMVLRGLAGVKQDLQLLLDRANHEQIRQTHGMTSLHDIARLFADVRRFRLLRMAEEARDLLHG